MLLTTRLLIAVFVLTALVTVAVAGRLASLDLQGGLVVGFIMIGPVLSLYRYVKRAVRGGEGATPEAWGCIAGFLVIAALYGWMLALLTGLDAGINLGVATITLPIAAYPGAAVGFLLGRFFGYLSQK